MKAESLQAVAECMSGRRASLSDLVPRGTMTRPDFFGASQSHPNNNNSHVYIPPPSN